MQALATHPAVVTGLLQHRPETSVCRPCVAHTVLPRPSFPSVLPGLVGRSHIPTALPTAFPVTCTGVSRPVTVSSALPGGTAHAKFLEVVSTEGITITQATPEYYSSCITASDRKALKKGLFHITDVVQPEEYTSIIESLQSRDGQKNLRKASRKVRHGLSLQDPDVVDTIAERISTHPFFDNCDYYKQKRRLQGAGHCSAPHQDHTDEFTPPYKYRVVLRFSADGVSPSDINFHTEDTLGPGSKRSASLEIASGQGYIMSGRVGLKGGGNIWHHDIPHTFNGLSLIIDFFES